MFLLSTGRTGTSATARYLNEAFEGVCALHEPRPSRSLRLASNAFLAGLTTEEWMIERLVKSRQRLCASVTEPVYVESNPYMNGFLSVLDQVFDRPHVVHIIRDPRTFVPSALNFGGLRGFKWLFTTLVPNWMIKPEKINPTTGLRWRRMTSIQRFAWFWRTVNVHLEQGKSLFPGRYRRVFFEDLVEPGGSGIRELAQWIGLEERSGRLEHLIARKVNPSRRRSVPPWEEWLEPDQAAVLEFCRPLMQKYGYLDQSPGSWRASRAHSLSHGDRPS